MITRRATDARCNRGSATDRPVRLLGRSSHHGLRKDHRKESPERITGKNHRKVSLHCQMGQLYTAPKSTNRYHRSTATRGRWVLLLGHRNGSSCLEAVVGPVVEQHPRVVQQLKPFKSEITILSGPPISTVVLEVAVAKIVDFRDQILGPNPSWGVNSPRVIALRGMDNLCVPRIVPCGSLSYSNEGFNVGL